jgi:hypothetical protein
MLWQGSSLDQGTHMAKVDGRNVVEDVNMPLLKVSSSSRCSAVSWPHRFCTPLQGKPNTPTGSDQQLLVCMRSKRAMHAQTPHKVSTRAAYLNSIASVTADVMPSTARVVVNTATLPAAAPNHQAAGAATTLCSRMYSHDRSAYCALHSTHSLESARCSQVQSQLFILKRWQSSCVDMSSSHLYSHVWNP